MPTGGNQTVKVTRRGYNGGGAPTEQITFTYDASNRLTERLVPGSGGDGKFIFTYDLTDRQKTALHANYYNLSTYDGAGRLLDKSEHAASATPTASEIMTVSYHYDAAGNQTKLIHPDGFAVDFVYDALNRVTAAKDGARTLASVAYDRQSRRQSVTYDNGTSVQYDYTPRGDLTCHDWNLTGTAPASCNTGAPEIAYDLGFNGVGQMISRSVSDPLLRWSPATNETDSYTPNGLNQYTDIDGASPTYDGNGNMIVDLKGQIYTYSAENVLTYVEDASHVRLGSYVHNADGTRRYVNRAGVGTRRFYFDGDQEILETDRGAGILIATAPVLRRYIRLPGSVDEPLLMIDYTINGSCTNTSYAVCERWAHQNYLGSVVAVTDSAGAVTERHTYSPYGVSGGSNSGFPFRFTGQKLDEATGLYFYKARYYDPETGRFMQTDPIGYEDQMNLYAYVANDPVNGIDPTGMCRPPHCPTLEDAKSFGRGTVEGLKGMYTAYKLSQDIKNGDARAIWIAAGMSLAVDAARLDKSTAAELSIKSLGNNLPRVLGRTAGGSASSIVGSKGAGLILGKLGAGKFTTSVAGLSVGATNFSSGQIAAATIGLGGLHDSISEAGFDPNKLSASMLADSAIVSATGGDLSFNAETGTITARLPSTTGSRIGETITLGTLKKE